MAADDFGRVLVELLVSLISLERNPEPSSIPAEYVLRIAPVFGRFYTGKLVNFIAGHFFTVLAALSDPWYSKRKGKFFSEGSISI